MRFGDSLTDLANQYGSDKGTKGPSANWSAHNYTDLYSAYLGHMRNQPLRLVEVGLGVPGPNWHAKIAHGRNEGGGGSVKMWRAWLPSARIYGLDINEANHLDQERLSTHVVDQGNPEQLTRFANEVGSQFDVIIDDGSHRPHHQQITLAALWPHLAPGGLYFIEDLLDNGLGDLAVNQDVGAQVRSTRSVLRSFANGDDFAHPHALGDTVRLVEEIADIAFHCPQVVRRVRLRRGEVRHPRQALHVFNRFRESSEELVVLRKTGQGEYAP